MNAEEIKEFFRKDNDIIEIINHRLHAGGIGYVSFPENKPAILTNKENKRCSCCGRTDCASFLAILPENKR